MAHSLAIDLAPPSANEVHLCISSIVAHSLLMIVVVWITWKHGKVGILCWPLLVSQLGIHIAGEAYKISRRNEPEIPDAFTVIYSAGTLACPSLALLGIVFEANIIIPQTHSRWIERLALGATHILNTAGIGLATYGGSPSAETSSGLQAPTLNKTGNLMMCFVLFLLCVWLIFTAKKLTCFSPKPNHKSAIFMSIAAGIGTPFQMVRLAHSTTFAFARIPSLDLVSGSFATKLVLGILPQLVISLALTWGGWYGRHIVPLATQRTALEPDACETGRACTTEAK